MIFKEMERLAHRNEPLPHGMSALDQATYLSLRCLYSHYRHGEIEQGDAEIEKRAIRVAHEQRESFDAFARRCSSQSIALWKNVECAINAYRKNRTLDNADRLADAIDGIGIPKEASSEQAS